LLSPLTPNFHRISWCYFSLIFFSRLSAAIDFLLISSWRWFSLLVLFLFLDHFL
jgi:hypothetical protein